MQMSKCCQYDKNSTFTDYYLDSIKVIKIDLITAKKLVT
ncbi:hypothetical protein NIES4101_56680 [Calothrix sp. NIES-4101]|nr:hypothetical protein NIES4101_56680 [Calothrix sp. NIES-4101]